MSKLEQSLVECKIISKEEICEFIKNISNYCGFRVDNISFINDEYMGFFNLHNNNLNINYDKIYDYYIPYNIESINNFNKEIIFRIFCLLSYAIQKTQIFDNETYKKYPSYYVMLISDFYRNDCFNISYTANIFALLNTISLLKKHNIDYKIFKDEYNNLIKNNVNEYIENDNDDLLNDIANLEMREDILFKYRYALQHYGTEKDLTKRDCKIYGYKK